MMSNKSVRAGAVVWALIAWAAWAALVPDAISGSPLVILNAVIALAGVIVMTLTVDARPARSVAHLLHDAEEAARRRP